MKLDELKDMRLFADHFISVIQRSTGDILYLGTDETFNLYDCKDLLDKEVTSIYANDNNLHIFIGD